MNVVVPLANSELHVFSQDQLFHLVASRVEYNMRSLMRVKDGKRSSTGITARENVVPVVLEMVVALTGGNSDTRFNS